MGGGVERLRPPRLLVAPAAALLSGTQLLAAYPLAIVALFAGPPLGILTHVHSLRNLRVHADGGVADA